MKSKIFLTACIWLSINWIFHRFHHFCASNLIDCLRVIVDKLNFSKKFSLRVRLDWFFACNRRYTEFFTAFIFAHQTWLTVCMWLSMNWIFYRIHHFYASNLINCLHVIVDKLNFSQNLSFLRVKFDWLSVSWESL